MGRFVEVCRRKGMKVNTGKNMMMVLNGEEYEVYVDGISLDYVSELGVYIWTSSEVC